MFLRANHKNIDQYLQLCCRHSVLGLHPFVVNQAIMFDDEAWNMCDDDADLLDLSSDGKNKANAAVVTGTQHSLLKVCAIDEGV